jgi:hypothetical protein
LGSWLRTAGDAAPANAVAASAMAARRATTAPGKPWVLFISDPFSSLHIQYIAARRKRQKTRRKGSRRLSKFPKSFMIEG